jgi:hypothetical protein
MEFYDVVYLVQTSASVALSLALITLAVKIIIYIDYRMENVDDPNYHLGRGHWEKRTQVSINNNELEVINDDARIKGDCNDNDTPLEDYNEYMNSAYRD